MTPLLASWTTGAFATSNAVWAAVETGAGDANPVELLVPYLNLGVIVVLVIMAVTKKGFIPKWVLDDQKELYELQLSDKDTAHGREMAQEVSRREAAEGREEEYKRLNADLQNYQRDQLQPALIETTRVVSAYVQALARRGEVQ